jgi:hypothetical protein
MPVGMVAPSTIPVVGNGPGSDGSHRSLVSPLLAITGRSIPALSVSKNGHAEDDRFLVSIGRPRPIDYREPDDAIEVPEGKALFVPAPAISDLRLGGGDVGVRERKVGSEPALEEPPILAHLARGASRVECHGAGKGVPFEHLLVGEARLE